MDGVAIRPGGRVAPYGFLAAVLAAALLGGVLASRMVADRGEPGTAASDLPRRATPDLERRTSFGVVAVEYVEELEPAALHGSAGKVGAAVGPEALGIDVAVALTNLSRRTVDYSPAQFRLRVGSAGTVPPASSGIRPGTLQPNAGIEGRLVFAVPRGAAALALEFREPGRTRPIVIDLEPAPRAPTLRQPGHRHH